MFDECTSEALTEGIRITVRSEYQPSHSRPGQFVFAYRVQILNENPYDVMLRSRHWIIVDQMGEREDVEGPGVVGEQPTLSEREAFVYTSGAALPTPRGLMRGTYTFDGPRGTFKAEIAEFALAAPNTLN
ncbi:MAG: Co2+/Mg2+ efflux protein ApaG [Myxococcota bacterium]